MADTRDSKVISILKRLGRPPAERPKISGVLTSQEEMAGFRVSKLAAGGEAAARLTAELGENGLNIRLIVHHITPRGESDLLICVEEEKLPAARKIIEPLAKKLAGSRVEIHPSIQVVSIYPHRENPAIAGEALAALGAAGIEVLAVGTAGSVISLVVKGRNLAPAVRTLEDAFVVG